MGCDIHCYIEFNARHAAELWYNFGGRINPGRNYSLFARLAGVRRGSEEPPMSLRGVPTDAAWRTMEGSRLYITKTEGEWYCTKEKAERYVKHSGSVYVNDRAGNPTWVTHPDWHSHHWLTPDEYAKAIEGVTDAREYIAILACLRSFEAQGCVARLVFWFDN